MNIFFSTHPSLFVLSSQGFYEVIENEFVGKDALTIGKYTDKALLRKGPGSNGADDLGFLYTVDTSCPRIDPRTETFYTFNPSWTTNPEEKSLNDLCSKIVAAGPKAEKSEIAHLSTDGQVHVAGRRALRGPATGSGGGGVLRG